MKPSPVRTRWIGWLLLLVTLTACTTYDYDVPDTAANLSGFERHFGFEAPADVNDVYYFADELGADSKYQLGFEAEPETVERIVAALGLILAMDADEVSQNLTHDFSWWDETDIEQATLYWKTNERRDYWQALWYSGSTWRVYYLEYSL